MGLMRARSAAGVDAPSTTRESGERSRGSRYAGWLAVPHFRRSDGCRRHVPWLLAGLVLMVACDDEGAWVERGPIAWDPRVAADVQEEDAPLASDGLGCQFDDEDACPADRPRCVPGAQRDFVCVEAGPLAEGERCEGALSQRCGVGLICAAERAEAPLRCLQPCRLAAEGACGDAGLCWPLWAGVTWGVCVNPQEP